MRVLRRDRESKGNVDPDKSGMIALEEGTNDVGCRFGTEVILDNHRNLIKATKKAAKQVASICILPSFTKLSL